MAQSDALVLTLGVVLAALYFFRGSIFSSSDSKKAPAIKDKASLAGAGDPRDFVAKMKANVSQPHPYSPIPK